MAPILTPILLTAVLGGFLYFLISKAPKDSAANPTPPPHPDSGGRQRMRTEQVEIYSDASNYAILRHPGRKFPGSLIQGDSLSILVHLAQSVFKRVKESGDEELIDDAQELRKELEFRLKHYEQVLAKNQIQLPYSPIDWVKVSKDLAVPTKPPNLIFGDADSEFIMALQQGFQSHPQITARVIDFRELVKLPDIDAFYLSLMAAERWGAQPVGLYKAQILVTMNAMRTVKRDGHHS